MDILETILKFIVFTVVLKVIIAHWTAERMMNLGKWLAGRNPRYQAIWNHYMNGHKTVNVLDCGEDRCVSL